MNNFINFCIASDYHSKSISLEKENELLKEKINNAIELIENTYKSLENIDKPIIFYEEILKILKD